MRLQRFEVSGYKNFRQAVVLDQLGAINVIHGENNVGKSNLLQAIDVFFALLEAFPRSPTAMSYTTRFEPIRWDQEALFHRVVDHPPAMLFNLESPHPITMAGTLLLDPDALATAKVYGGEVQAATLEIELQIERDFSVRYEVLTLRLLDQGGNWSVSEELTHHRWAILLESVLVPFSLEKDIQPRYVLIGTDRRTRSDRHSSEGEPAAPVNSRSEGLIPDSLLLALYDAKESIEPLRYRRWELFVEVMREFEDIVGKGQLVATYDRRMNKANLALQTDKARIPVDVQGSGVQQLVALLARLLRNDATIVAIEEPELNLRFDLQCRVRDVLAQIVASPAGPAQIFLTSHSPAFESGECFYAMRATDHGPVVERRKVEEAPLFTTHLLEGHPPGSRAPLSYVSSEGLVQLPESIRKELGLEHGGGVVILKRDQAPYVEFLTNEQFLDLMSGHDSTEQGDEEG